MQSFDITIAVSNANDAYGESTFLGAGRTANKSGGKGLLEIESLLWSNVKSLGESSDIRVFSRGKGAAQGTPAPDASYIAWRTYRFEAGLGAEYFYQAATGLAVAVPGAGAANASWTRAPVRFDYRRQVLVYKTGATAPTTITDGTVATLSGTPDGVSATSKNLVLAAGVWSFSLFTIYDEVGSGTDAQVSAAVTKTVTVT